MTAIRTIGRLVPGAVALVSVLALMGAIAAPIMRGATPTTVASRTITAASASPWAPTSTAAPAGDTPFVVAEPGRARLMQAADEAPDAPQPPDTLDDLPAAPLPAPTPTPTPAATPAAPASIKGPSIVIPEMGIRQAVTAMPCDHVRPVLDEVYHWECAGTNNLYLLGHAYSVFKGLHDTYEAGRLHVGLTATYTDAAGHATTYAVTEWRVVTQDQVGWAVAAQPVASMTLQTCLGANSEYRLLVRLVAIS